MSKSPRRSSNQPARPRPRPQLNATMAKQQGGQFPTVGMTLRSYQYDPKDRNNRRGRPVMVKRSRFHRWTSKITLKRSVIVVALLVLLIGGWVGGKFAYNAHKLFGGNILGILKTTKLKGEDEGRVNILLAGNSADDPGHDGANLTDSIMVMSVDTKHNKAFLLSIPRDLWVELPGGGHQKINAAYPDGQSEDFSESGYPSGGMGELEQIVSENMGLPIHYYALIDYNALKQAVDAVGGIDLNIQSKDPRGLYDPNIDWSTKGPLVKLTNGVHHLNGQQALDLARARGDAYNSYGFLGSDFDRTDHQRQMLVALKSKAVSAGVMSNPAKLSSLSDAIGNNVKTDFTLPEVHRLYDITKLIPGSSIQSLSLNSANGKNLLMSYASPSGQSALAPAAGVDDYSDIQSFINQQTSNDPVVQEAAQIEVLNGTTVNGLATRIKTKLVNNKLQVADVDDAGITSQVTTTIIDVNPGKKPATRAALVKLFGSHVTTQNPYAGVYKTDFIIVVGSDQSTSTTTNTTGSTTNSSTTE
jgi:LCP family protein required for cell wall assembly